MIFETKERRYNMSGIKKHFSIQALSILLTFLASLSVPSIGATSEQQLPKPKPEHAWLQQFIGEWEAETECREPGKEPIKSKGTEKARSLGDFWIVHEVKGTMQDKPFTGVMTLGYDPDKKKYVGTWVDSVSSKLWQYEGTVDPAGKKLTLETEGSCPMSPGKLMKFKEVIELKDKDHKIFTSSMQGDDGTWTTVMTSKAQRIQ